MGAGATHRKTRAPRQTPATTGGTRDWPWWMPGLLLAVAALLAYGNTFKVPFVFDDQLAIVENQTIRDLSNPRAVLSPPTGGITVHARPLVNAAHALNYALHGLHVGGFHALNLAIHIVNGWLLYGLLRRLLAADRTAPPIIPLCATLVWLLHPLCTQAVTYISQRAESMAAMFYLLSLYALLRAGASASTVTPRWAAIAVLSAAAGMATKETTITLPLTALLFDRACIAGSWRTVWQQRRALHLALLSTVLIRMLLMLQPDTAQHAMTGFGSEGSSWLYLLTQSEVILRYLRLAVWPSGQCFDTQWPIASGLTAVWPAVLVVSAAVLASGYAWIRNPRIGFPLLAFWIILAPTSSIMPIVDAYYEHRLYLPLAALIGLVIPSAMNATRRRGHERSAVLACLLIALTLGVATHLRNRDYRTAMSLWEDTIRKRPDNARAWYNRGHLHELAGRPELALADFAQALALNPDYAGPYYNMGNIHMAAGRLEQAIACYDNAIARETGNVLPYYNRGIARSRLNRLEDALEDFERCIAIAPWLAIPYYSQGDTLSQLERYAEAILAYTRAIERDPAHVDAWHNRAAAHAMLGDVEHARADLEQCRRLGSEPAPELLELLRTIARP